MCAKASWRRGGGGKRWGVAELGRAGWDVAGRGGAVQHGFYDKKTPQSVTINTVSGRSDKARNPLLVAKSTVVKKV